MHYMCHLVTCEGVLNISPSGEMDHGRKHYPSSLGRKHTSDGTIQTRLIGRKYIDGDNTGLMWKPLI